MEISIAGISIRQISITQIYIGIRLKQEGIRGGWLVREGGMREISITGIPQKQISITQIYRD